MAKQASSALANYLEADGSWGEFLKNFLLMFYTGSQPANADAAASGVACVRFSQAAGAVTKETRAEWKCTLSGTTSGSVDTVTIGGLNILPAAVAYTASHTNTAALVAAAINSARNVMGLTARSSGDVFYITAPKNCGVDMNDMVLAVTATTLTATVASTGKPAASGGTDGIAAVNCLSLVYPAVDGVCAKEATVWQGIVGSGAGAGYIGFVNSFTSGTQTVGWFRAYGSMDDPELTGTPTQDASKLYLRYDGTIGVDLTATGGTVVTFGATQTQNSFTHSTLRSQG